MSEGTKDDDAFGCVIVGLACESRVKSECGQRKGKYEGLLIRFRGKVVEQIEEGRCARLGAFVVRVGG